MSIVAFTLLVLGACGGADTGSADLSVAVSAISSSDVTSVTVSATNGTDTLSTTLTMSGTTWQGTMTSIPAGAGWVFTGTASDVTNVPIFTGSSLPVTIVAGQTASVLLELEPVTPPPSFGNHAPHIDSLVVSSVAVAPADVITLAAGASDADGDLLTYQWTDNPNGNFTTPTQSSTSWSTPAEGVYLLTITVTDPYQAFDAVSVSIDVHATNDEGAADITATINAFPEVQDVILSTGHLQPGVPVTARVDATDSDGDTLTYTWSDTCSGMWAPNPDNTATYTLPLGSTATSCTLTAHVDDGHGGSNFGSLTVVVGADP